MKKWLKFFWLSFFSNETSKDGVRRGFSNFFLALILSLVILCAGFIGADILPFNKHYSDANGFSATARKVFANENEDKSIIVHLFIAPNYEMERLLLGFGCGIEILKPESLRNRMKKMLEKALEKYAE